MKKISLDMDAIEVESFHSGQAVTDQGHRGRLPESRNTVIPHCMTCVEYSCACTEEFRTQGIC